MGSKKSKEKTAKTATFSDCRKHAEKALNELNCHVCELVGELDDQLRADHDTEIAECRKRSDAQMPQLGVSVEVLGDEDNDGLHIARVLWFVDLDFDESFRPDKVDQEGTIKPMSPNDGHYWRSELRRALPKLARWEIDLIWKFERRAQYLRHYVNRVESAVSALCDFDPLPSIEDLKYVDDRGQPASFTINGRV